MWYGVGEYLVLALVVSLVLHLYVRRFATATLAGAILSSVLNLVHEAWVAGFDVQPGWTLPLFFAGFLLALPVGSLVGVPFVALRKQGKG